MAQLTEVMSDYQCIKSLLIFDQLWKYAQQIPFENAFQCVASEEKIILK